eukprot:gene3472-6913_t
MSGTSLPRVNSLLQPISLKGHERSITQVKYNADGDLLFTTAKDKKPTVWYAETGERLGTYGYHSGSVWDIDPSWDSKYVLTAGADGSARLFEVTTGKYIARMPHRGPVRVVAWGEGTKVFATISDPFHSRDQGVISIFEFPSEDVLMEACAPVGGSADPAPLHTAKLEILVDEINKATSLGWTIGDQHIIAGFEDGHVIKYDVKTGKEIQRVKMHTDRVNRLNFNKDKTLFITGSKDTTAHLVDPVTLTILKTYRTDRPVNAAVISPLHPHVLLGGGQDAMSVTVTSASQGKFETRFYHMIYEEEFGRVKGHFGPINAIAIHPDGTAYASGAEDGYVRVHKFDAPYLTMSDFIPEDVKLLRNSTNTPTTNY